jgi:hypothetical protein
MFGTRTSHDDTGQALALLGALLAPEACAGPPPLPPAAAWTLVGMAGRHLLTPGLWSALATRGATGLLPPDLREYVEALHALNARRNARLREQVEDVAAAMHGAGVRAAFLKGTALLLLGHYPDAGARFIGDIDLLVAEDRTEAAARALAALGYQRLPDGAAHVHDRIRLVHPGRPAMIELHQCAIQLAMEPLMPTRPVLARAVAAGGGAALVPGLVDLVVHNVAHAMIQHGFFRQAEVPLRDAYDLVLLADHSRALDWPAVSRRLAIGPWGPDILAFYAGATNAVFPGARLPAPDPSPRAARALRRWRARRGRPPSPAAVVLGNLAEFSEDRLWRLRTLPGEPRRMLGRIFTPRRYPFYVAALVEICRDGWPPSEGRIRTTGTDGR